MNNLSKNRNWTVLLVGGASGTGKSCFAKAIARHYAISVLEIDDIGQSLKAMTTKDTLPALHYFSTGVDWRDIGVSENVNWLIRVSKEMIPALTAIIKRHIEDDVPIIMEGDFLYPDLAASFSGSEVKSLFIIERDKNQILQNLINREGGSPQHYRADISIAYGKWLSEECKKRGLNVIESRPWNNALSRSLEYLE